MTTESRLKAVEEKIDQLYRLIQLRVVDEMPGLLNRISGIEGGVSYAANLYLQAQRAREAEEELAKSATLVVK